MADFRIVVALLLPSLRQGCPLSPLLFILFIADIGEYLRKRYEGGITIGDKRVYTQRKRKWRK